MRIDLDRVEYASLQAATALEAADLSCAIEKADEALDLVRDSPAVATSEPVARASDVKVTALRYRGQLDEADCAARAAVCRGRLGPADAFLAAKARAQRLHIAEARLDLPKATGGFVTLAQAFEHDPRAAAFVLDCWSRVAANAVKGKAPDIGKLALERAKRLAYEVSDPELVARYHFWAGIYEIERDRPEFADSFLLESRRIIGAVPRWRMHHRFAVAHLEIRHGDRNEGLRLFASAADEAEQLEFRQTARTARRFIEAFC